MGALMINSYTGIVRAGSRGAIRIPVACSTGVPESSSSSQCHRHFGPDQIAAYRLKRPSGIFPRYGTPCNRSLKADGYQLN